MTSVWLYHKTHHLTVVGAAASIGWWACVCVFNDAILMIDSNQLHKKCIKISQLLNIARSEEGLYRRYL